jgi:CotH protein/chitobiase/beta-hexosaminidase-like protein
VRIKHLFLLAALLGLLLSVRFILDRDRAQQPPPPGVHVRGGDPRISKDFFPGGIQPRDVRELHLPADTSPTDRRSIPGAVRFSPPPGRYPLPVQVTLSTDVQGGTIRSTLDFTEPGPESDGFKAPLTIARSAVIRARAWNGDGDSTRVVSATYLIGGAAGPEPLPTLSITMDPAVYATVQTSAWLRGRSSERPAYLEVIDAEGRQAAATGFGIRLHGGAGRNGGMEVKKSYRAYFRKQYGEGKLRWPIIPDAPRKGFDKLVLRAGYNDRLRPGRGEYNVKAAYIRDQVIRDLHREMGFPSAHGSWCFLYVNLDFWGLYNIVERLDDEFLSGDLHGKKWDVINTGEGVLAGSVDAWMDLRDFLARADLSRDADFAEVSRRVDLENFTDYIIINLWSQNFDWPHNNWYAARKREEGARWIFLVWDAEWGMGLRPWGFQADAAQALVFNQGGGLIRDLFRELIANPKYRSYFLDELHRQLRSALAPESVLRAVERQKGLVDPVMKREIDTFFRQGAYSTWLRNVQEMETFARMRGPVFEEQMRSFLSDPPEMPGAATRR